MNSGVAAPLLRHLLTNNNQTLSDGSQRKLVRTGDGIYHLIYESLSAIWYTHSLTTDFNGTWSDEMGVELGENPSVANYGNTLKIVCEKANPDFSAAGKIEVITISDYNNYNTWDFEEVADYSTSYYGSAKPVITYNNTFTFIVYRKNPSTGLYRLGKVSSGSWEEDVITGTNANCFNPSVTCMASSVFLAYENFYNIYYNSAGYAGWRFNETPKRSHQVAVIM